ncbi:MAG: hypothetical protein CMJ18_11855 [Phycisphaeraceae bacterium]|nr:hypothetical protein [Phycisphaeraceae bacterium]
MRHIGSMSPHCWINAMTQSRNAMARTVSVMTAAALLFATAACQSGPSTSQGAPPTPVANATVNPGTAPEPEAGSFIQTEPLEIGEVIRPRDRILFLGDELTQQMHYTRAIATALLPLYPRGDLRFFNGGLDGATAASLGDRAEELIELTRPTLVFVCLGLNDAAATRPAREIEAGFRTDLAALVERIRAARRPRVVLISPPPLERESYSASNATIYRLAIATRDVAAAAGAGFVDMHVPMSKVYSSSTTALTFDGRMPTEQGHVILASIVLYGIGVEAEKLDAVGWSPLLPLKMGQIRGALGLPLRPVEPVAATRSRRLYESMIQFDQQVFRAWRLEKGERRRDVLTQADGDWKAVREALAQYR